MDIKFLDSIYKSIQSKSINQLTIESKNFKINLIKGQDKTLAGQKDFSSPDFEGVNTVEQPSDINKKGDFKKQKVNKNDICSNQVGFFSRFGPNKKQYVKLRDVVKKGDVVAKIISLKTPNDLVATKNGKIVNFLVEEGQPVEYGQPVIRLE